MKKQIILLFITFICLCGYAEAAWSIPDPSDSSGETPATGAYLDSVLQQGYWQFEYDKNDPSSAAMPCCWWEMVYGNLHKYYAAAENASSDSSSSSSSVETKSYCPACHVDDEYATLEAEPDLQDLKKELMETKPWLNEEKTTNKTKNTSTYQKTSTSVMSFSEPVKY